MAAAIFEAAGWWSPPATAADVSEPTLAPWIFVIVYGSFIVLGIGLMIAFAVYAWSRFRPAVRGAVDEIPPGATHPAQIPLAWLAAVVTIGLAAVRLSWAIGGTAGLQPGTRDVWLRLGDTVTAVQFSCAAVGVLVLVHRWGKNLPFALPLIATWLGAGGMAATGFLRMPTILTGDQWAPAGLTFTAHATSNVLTRLPPSADHAASGPSGRSGSWWTAGLAPVKKSSQIPSSSGSGSPRWGSRRPGGDATVGRFVNAGVRKHG